MRQGHRAYWSFTLYPEAAEGGGCFVPTLRAQPIGGGVSSDPERSQLEAARRARAKLRRYAAANRLNRLGTLTYAGEGCFDQAQLRVDLGEFFRGLRRELGGERLPYIWGPGVASGWPRSALPFRGRPLCLAEADRRCVGAGDHPH
jgi:hypothetical protein